MKRYEIMYLDGTTESVEADDYYFGEVGGDYITFYRWIEASAKTHWIDRENVLTVSNVKSVRAFTLDSPV